MKTFIIITINLILLMFSIKYSETSLLSKLIIVSTVLLVIFRNNLLKLINYFIIFSVGLLFGVNLFQVNIIESIFCFLIIVYSVLNLVKL